MNEENKKLIYVKTNNKKRSIPGLEIALLGLIIVSLSFYVFMKLLYIVFSGANIEGKNNKVSNNLLPDIFSNKIFLIIFIILIVLLLVSIISKSLKNENKLPIEVDKNKGIKCKKCGHVNDIENKSCCNCGFGAKVSYLCPNCNVYNNISNTECIKCGEKIDLIDVKKQVQKASYKELSSLIISGILLLILLPSSKSDDLIIPIIFVCLFLNYLIKYIKYYKVIKEIGRIITDN